MITVYTSLILICLLFIAVAHLKKTPLSFYLGSQKYGPIISATSIVAAFTGGGAVLNTSGLATQYGNWALFDVFPSVLGLLLCALFVRVKFFGKSFSANFFNVEGSLYDRRAILVHYAQIGLLYTLVIAAQLRAVATVAVQLNIPVWLAIAVCCVTVAAYASRGFNAVTKTDVAQLLLMLPMYFILAYIAFEPAVKSPALQVNSMPVPLVLALCLPLFFLPISQEIHQRGAAAEEKAVGTSYLLAAIIYLLMGLLLVTAFSKNHNLSLIALITGTNPFAAAVIAIGVFAAILSTLDTSTNIASHAFQQLPRIEQLPPSFVQAGLLAVGSILFLFFPTILSLILFALFVYMAGPALSFVAMYSGIHPKKTAFIGAVFVALQTTGQFRPTVFTQLPLMPKSFQQMDSIQIGLALILIQIFVLVVMKLRRKFR